MSAASTGLVGHVVAASWSRSASSVQLEPRSTPADDAALLDGYSRTVTRAASRPPHSPARELAANDGGRRSVEVRVKASVLYRVASGLLLLFAVGHTLGFRQADPAWGAEAVLGAMQSSRFVVQGFTRTYWDFFLGAGFTVGVLYLFAMRRTGALENV